MSDQGDSGTSPASHAREERWTYGVLDPNWPAVRRTMEEQPEFKLGVFVVQCFENHIHERGEWDRMACIEDYADDLGLLS